MNSISKRLWLVVLLLVVGPLSSQDSDFSGSYVTPDGPLGLQLKPITTELHGVLTSAEGMYALRVQIVGKAIEGTVFTDAGNYEFTGQPMLGGIHKAIYQ